MQRYVDISPHLTYVATLPCETRITEKTNEIHRVPKKLSQYIHHKIMANCHFITNYIINNSLKQCVLCKTTTSPD